MPLYWLLHGCWQAQLGSSCLHSKPLTHRPHALGPSEYKIYLAPSEALGSLGGKFLGSFPGVSFLVDVKYTLGICLLIHA